MTCTVCHSKISKEEAAQSTETETTLCKFCRKYYQI